MRYWRNFPTPLSYEPNDQRGDGMEAVEPDSVDWPLHVMVVDDEPILRSLLADALRDAGFTVVEAASADEAFAYMQAHARIDLVMTDIHMPGSVDGLGLAAKLKANNPLLPIIITSGNAGPTGGGELGSFIPKPYRLAEAVSLVFERLGIEPRPEVE